MWMQDNVILHSVGVDIGSATTQVAFSRLHLRRHAADLTSRYVVVERELVHDAGVHLTPYVEGRLIDAEGLGHLLDDAYGESGWTADDIDTGAVILTGEALRRANAELIGTVVAERAGQLVCATAGHHMEALLAAYGSGAVRRSFEDGSTLLNVDIGGGTTKLTLVQAGRVVGTSAFLVGGRLIVLGGRTITRLEPGGTRHAAEAGFAWEVGSAATSEDLARVAEQMADKVIAAIGGAPGLYLTDVMPIPRRLDGVLVSGGVSAYLHGREVRDFGDLGPHLASALAARLDQFPGPLLAGDEAIRATVVGASEHTVQLSGLTGYLSDADASLPRRNLPVARMDFALGEDVDEAAVAYAVRASLAERDLIDPDLEAVVAISWTGAPRYGRVSALARGLSAGLGARMTDGRTAYLMVDGDVAMTLGRILVEELGVKAALVVLDGIQLREFDHVDLGRARPISGNVPITIKSLAFNHSGL